MTEIKLLSLGHTGNRSWRGTRKEIMFEKILVPIQDEVDSQDRSIFENVLELAKWKHSNLMLLHVISSELVSPSIPRIAMPEAALYASPVVTDDLVTKYREIWRQAEKQGQNMLQALAEEARSQGIHVETAQDIGDRGRVVCSIAQSWGADLIVVGKPERSKLGEMFLGSISNYVVHNAACPVIAI